MLSELLRSASKKTIESYSIKPEKSGYTDSPISESKKEHYPTISISNKILPEIEEWKDGEEYVIVLKVKQVGSSSYSHNGKNDAHADLEVREAAYIEQEKEEKEDNDESTDKIKKIYS